MPSGHNDGDDDDDDDDADDDDNDGDDDDGSENYYDEGENTTLHRYILFNYKVLLPKYSMWKQIMLRAFTTIMIATRQ